MARLRGARFWACLALVASLYGNAMAKPSRDVAYCASVNTAGLDADPAEESDFQSMGRCYTTCSSAKEQYAFAVVWQKSCWCTNTVPNKADTVATDQCSNPCPGYPDDWCGGDSLFGYLKITGVKPSSTAAPASTSTTQQSTKMTTKPTTKPTTTAVVITKTETEQTTAITTLQSTVRETVTVIPSVKSSVTSSTGISSSTMSTTSSTTISTTLVTSGTQSTDDPATTDPTQPTTQTVTVGGTVQTIIVTPAPAPTAPSGGQLAEPEANGKKKAISTGAAVGIAIGVVAALGIIGVLLWLWCMRRRKQNEEGSSFGSPRGSSSGMTKGVQVTETRFGPDAVAWEGPGSKRRSTLMPVDPRLNPYGNALYNGQNKSRESIASFQDNQDYSRRVVGQPRVLRAVNPDPITED